MKYLTEILLVMFGTSLLAFAAPNPDQYSVRDFGAAGDSKTDDTAAFQKALDAAHQAGGGVVYAPRGNYFFAGHLSVPAAVTLRGVWESVPSHVGIRNAGAESLAKSRHLERLGSLHVGCNLIGREGKEALRERFGERVRF